MLDFVDNCRHPAISLPYLIGLPAEMDVKGKSIRQAKEQFDRVAKEFPTANLQDVRSLDELDSVAEKISLFDVKYPPEVSKLTELAWRKAGDGFFLPVDRGRITIAQDLREDWWVRGTVGGRKIEIAAQNLVGAFAAADRAIMDAGAPKVLLARDSRWRDAQAQHAAQDRAVPEDSAADPRGRDPRDGVGGPRRTLSERQEMMANRPSQGCLACEGRGWFQAGGLNIRQCPVCNGFGRITIKLARILRWYPIRHGKRQIRPKQLALLGGGDEA